jgi:hypothetical protein
MKKIIITLVVLASFTFNVSAQKIVGAIETGNPEITLNKQDLIKTFNKNLLEASKIDGQFSSVSLIKYKTDYLLVFKGAKLKSAFLVTQGAKDARGNITLVAANKTTCTTSACASEQFGCVPDGNVGGGACTPCANNGVCTKTVSNNSLLD